MQHILRNCYCCQDYKVDAVCTFMNLNVQHSEHARSLPKSVISIITRQRFSQRNFIVPLLYKYAFNGNIIEFIALLVSLLEFKIILFFFRNESKRPIIVPLYKLLRNNKLQLLHYPTVMQLFSTYFMHNNGASNADSSAEW